MLELILEWDPEKEWDNIKDHGVNFTDASDVFLDHFRIERHDDDSSDNEDRWQTMGFVDDVLCGLYGAWRRYPYNVGAGCGTF